VCRFNEEVISVRLGRTLNKDVFLQQLSHVDVHMNSQWKFLCIEGRAFVLSSATVLFRLNYLHRGLESLVTCRPSIPLPVTGKHYDNL
jgi:hypothetical protein